MLKAKKSNRLEKVFAIYNRNLIKRRFHSIQVSGLEILENRNKLFPLIVYANHSSWWDGLVAFQISRKANLDSFIIMEEKQLKKLFFFRKLGAFSVARENGRNAFRSINYAAEILTETENRALWIFPQGEILSNEIRPLKFFNGLSHVIKKVDKCYAVPLAIKYEFLENYKPEIFIRIGAGELISGGANFFVKRKTQEFEIQLTQTLDRLKIDIQNKNFAKFEKI